MAGIIYALLTLAFYGGLLMVLYNQTRFRKQQIRHSKAQTKLLKSMAAKLGVDEEQIRTDTFEVLNDMDII